MGKGDRGCSCCVSIPAACAAAAADTGLCSPGESSILPMGVRDSILPGFLEEEGGTCEDCPVLISSTLSGA